MIKVDEKCFIEIFHSKDKLWIKVQNHYLEHLATVMTFSSSISLDDAIQKFKKETRTA